MVINRLNIAPEVEQTEAPATNLVSYDTPKQEPAPVEVAQSTTGNAEWDAELDKYQKSTPEQRTQMELKLRNSGLDNNYIRQYFKVEQTQYDIDFNQKAIRLQEINQQLPVAEEQLQTIKDTPEDFSEVVDLQQADAYSAAIKHRNSLNDERIDIIKDFWDNSIAKQVQESALELEPSAAAQGNFIDFTPRISYADLLQEGAKLHNTLYGDQGTATVENGELYIINPEGAKIKVDDVTTWYGDLWSNIDRNIGTYSTTAGALGLANALSKSVGAAPTPATRVASGLGQAVILGIGAYIGKNIDYNRNALTLGLDLEQSKYKSDRINATINAALVEGPLYIGGRLIEMGANTIKGISQYLAGGGAGIAEGIALSRTGRAGATYLARQVDEGGTIQKLKKAIIDKDEEALGDEGVQNFLEFRQRMGWDDSTKINGTSRGISDNLEDQYLYYAFERSPDSGPVKQIILNESRNNINIFNRVKAKDVYETNSHATGDFFVTRPNRDQTMYAIGDILRQTPSKNSPYLTRAVTDIKGIWNQTGKIENVEDYLVGLVRRDDNRLFSSKDSRYGQLVSSLSKESAEVVEARTISKIIDNNTVKNPLEADITNWDAVYFGRGSSGNTSGGIIDMYPVTELGAEMALHAKKNAIVLRDATAQAGERYSDLRRASPVTTIAETFEGKAKTQGVQRVWTWGMKQVGADKEGQMLDYLTEFYKNPSNLKVAQNMIDLVNPGSRKNVLRRSGQAAAAAAGTGAASANFSYEDYPDEMKVYLQEYLNKKANNELPEVYYASQPANYESSKLKATEGKQGFGFYVNLERFNPNEAIPSSKQNSQYAMARSQMIDARTVERTYGNFNDPKLRNNIYRQLIDEGFSGIRLDNGRAFVLPNMISDNNPKDNKNLNNKLSTNVVQVFNTSDKSRLTLSLSNGSEYGAVKVKGKWEIESLDGTFRNIRDGIERLEQTNSIHISP